MFTGIEKNNHFIMKDYNRFTKSLEFKQKEVQKKKNRLLIQEYELFIKKLKQKIGDYQRKIIDVKRMSNN